MRTLRTAPLAATLAALSLAPATAGAAITITPGDNRIQTSKLELDLGNGSGNVERVDNLRWVNGAGALSPNFVAAGGTPDPSCSTGEALETFGQAYGWSNVNPMLAAAGATGSLTQRGTRTVELNSSVPTNCSGDTVVTPVRTRYTFFDSGSAANKYRVERRFSFAANTPFYGNTAGLRAYVPRVSNSFSEVQYPNASESQLLTASPFSCPDGCPAPMSWNGKWFAVNNPNTNDGFVVLRDPASTTPSTLVLDYDAFSGVNSSVVLTQPGLGWTAPLTEVEYLCFYDIGSWPLASRGPNSPPPGCTAAAVPVNTASPAISGTARDGLQLNATNGTWDSATAGFTYVWSRCDGATCTAIPGATSPAYIAVEADVGKRIRVAVTAANAASSETDTATALSDVVAPTIPSNTALPSVAGSAAPGETLTATTGSWTGSPTSFDPQWRSCDGDGNGCSDIAGATGSTYTVAAADLGRRIRVRVVASNSAGPSNPADSAATPVIAAGNIAPAATRPPTITGAGDTPRPGQVLGLDTGDWIPAPSSFQLSWLRCNSFGLACAPIPGATGNGYLLTNDDLERTIRARVVAVGPGGTSEPIDSAPTAFVRRAPLAASLSVIPNPTCTGTETRMSGAASGPDVARYRFEYTQRVVGRQMETVVVSDNAAPRVEHLFTWNRPTFEFAGTGGVPSTQDLVLFADWQARPVYIRDDVDVKLTVTDVRGQTATATQHVTFARQRSDQGGIGCVRAAAQAAEGTRFLKQALTSVKLASTNVSATIPCIDKVNCVGVLSITGVRVSRGARASARARTPVYAAVAFSVPSGKTQKVRAPYTKATRRLLRRGKKLKAKATISVIGANGRKVVRSKRLTLR